MKQNKFNTWLTSLLVMVMLAFVGQTAMAQDAEVTLDFGYSSKTVNGVVVTTYCSTWGNHLNPCNSGEYIQFAAPENMVITKIELTNTYKWSGDFSNLTVNSGTLAAQSGTSTWTGSSNEVIITVSGTIDVMFDAANIWIESTGGEEPTPDDGSKTYTYNFKGSAISYTTGGSASTLTGGKNLQVGDIFTSSEGGTLTFTAVASSWSNNAERLRLGSATEFNIAAPEGYLISEIVFNTDANTLSGLSATGLTFNSTTKATWTGSAASVPVYVTADSWVQTIKVKVVPASVEPTTYTVNVSNAPTGAAVVLDGNDLTAGGQITVEKILNLTNLEITEPSGYYAEKEYDATTHTFTVTFKAYLQYPVVVTGTTDANAGVVYDGVTYHAGESVLTKTALTAADVTAAEVSGLEGTVTLDAGTFTVTYKIPEYIEFVTTGIAKSNYSNYTDTKNEVTISGMIYSQNINLYSSYKLNISSASRNIVKVEIESGSQMSNASANTGTFTASTGIWTGCAQSIEFSANGGDYYITKIKVYLEELTPKTYTVSITGNPSEAKLTYNSTEYVNGATFEATGLQESDLSATEIAGYIYTITIDGTTINVAYEVEPTKVTWDFAVDTKGTYTPYTKQGVTVVTQYWTGSQADLYEDDVYNPDYGYVTISSEYPITKIVFHGTSNTNQLISTTGSFTGSGTNTTSTWEGNATEITFGTLNGVDAYISTMEIYTTAPADAFLDVNIGSTGYATFYYADKYAKPTGLKAYYCVKNSENTLSPVLWDKNYLVDNTAYIFEGNMNYTYCLKKLANDYSVDEISEMSDLVNGNVLVGTTEDLATADAKTTYGVDDIFVFSKVDGKVGFYKFAGATLGAHKAFYAPKELPLGGPTSTEVNGFVLDFDGVEGINTVVRATNLKAGYDIQGRRINSIQKGINILNGKKIIK